MTGANPGPARRILRFDSVVEVIVAKPGVDRHSLHGPRVLHEQTEIGDKRFVRRIRRRSHCHLERLAVADDEVRVLVGVDIGVSGPLLQVHSRLQGMRSGDVVERRPIRPERCVVP